MRQIKVAAPAKINLSLDVVGRRADGYHMLSTVMQSVDLADRLTVTIAGRPTDDRPGFPASPSIQVRCNRPDVPTDRRNTAFRAGEAFLAEAGQDLRVEILIEKEIPAAAGLAGGSADAAAVLFALDRLLPGSLPRTRLFALAAAVGADVPFCLQGGTVLCEGIGEVLTALPPFADIPVLLAKPGFSLSTPWVFGRLDRQNQGEQGGHLRQPAVLAALASRDLAALAAVTGNYLETVSLPAYPQLQEIKDQLRQSGAAVVLMSGSGPTVYGLFEQAGRRDAALALLAADARWPDLWLKPANTLATGPHEV
jgi:4-diphosphocytidyl-2-C-methyl-D-erythritol kinase